MSAIYWVRYHESAGRYYEGVVSVMSADSRSMRKGDLRKAKRGAIVKARAKIAAQGVLRPVIIDCRCVG